MPVLELTEAAARKAQALLAQSEFPNGALRVHVKNGGCSGMRYELLFDDTVRDDDDEFDQFGLTVRVDAESARFLEGVKIDFSSDLNDAGFKIDNPAAETVCGCGESFAL
jgi:iron-sulfur cluster assembly protein